MNSIFVKTSPFIAFLVILILTLPSCVKVETVDPEPMSFANQDILKFREFGNGDQLFLVDGWSQNTLVKKNASGVQVYNREYNNVISPIDFFTCGEGYYFYREYTSYEYYKLIDHAKSEFIAGLPSSYIEYANYDRFTGYDMFISNDTVFWFDGLNLQKRFMPIQTYNNAYSYFLSSNTGIGFWAGQSNLLSGYRNGMPESYPTSGPVQNICFDSNQKLWCIVNGEIACLENGSLKIMNSGNSGIYNVSAKFEQMGVDALDRLWVGTSQTVYRYDIQNDHFMGIASSNSSYSIITNPNVESAYMLLQGHLFKLRGQNDFEEILLP